MARASTTSWTSSVSGKITATNAISSNWTGLGGGRHPEQRLPPPKPVDSGIGWTLVDATHNLPADAQPDFTPPIDYKAEYKKAWGVG